MRTLKELHVVAHGDPAQGLRRYHMDVPFPNEHFNFEEGHKDAWIRYLRVLGTDYPYARLAHVLGLAFTDPGVVDGTLRTYNFTVRRRPQRRELLVRNTARFETRLVELGGGELRVPTSGGLFRTYDRLDAMEVIFEEFDRQSAVGPAPFKRLRIKLPGITIRDMISVERGIDHWGYVEARASARADPRVLQMISEISHIDGVASITFGPSSLGCNVGLAFDRIAIARRVVAIVNRVLEGSFALTG